MTLKRKHILSTLKSSLVIRIKNGLPTKLVVHVWQLYIRGQRDKNLRVPLVWREPKNRHADCNFCVVSHNDFNSKTKHAARYPDIPSPRRLVDHCAEVPIFAFFSLPSLQSEESSNSQDEMIWSQILIFIFRPYWNQSWSPRGHILKSLALRVKTLALASKPQVLKNCPVLGSRRALFFEPLKLCITIVINGQRCQRICYR